MWTRAIELAAAYVCIRQNVQRCVFFLDLESARLVF